MIYLYIRQTFSQLFFVVPAPWYNSICFLLKYPTSGMKGIPDGLPGMAHGCLTVRALALGAHLRELPGYIVRIRSIPISMSITLENIGTIAKAFCSE